MKMRKSISPPAPAWMPWLMWGLVAGFYLIGFFQRVAPAVMVDELMREFHIGGALLGNLSGSGSLLPSDDRVWIVNLLHGHNLALRQRRGGRAIVWSRDAFHKQR